MYRLNLLILVTIVLAGCASSSPGLEEAALLATPMALDLDDPLVQDAASYAEAVEISLEEAVRRLEYQETIGDIQPLLASELAEIYAGLWVEHQPGYRIVIALTEGDETTIAPYVQDKAWREYVTVEKVTYTQEELMAAQDLTNELTADLNFSLATAVDIMNNRVELSVGNPELLQADLDAAGIELPEAVIIVPISTAGPLPQTNAGILLTAQTASGRTVYLPKQPPAAASMDALLEGQLVEADGCLRVTAEGYSQGFLVIWPHDTSIRVSGAQLEILNGAGEIVARTDEWLRLGGGALENSLNMGRVDELIPGMPLAGCPGPYWVAGQLETVAEQAIGDIYVNPWTRNGVLLAQFFTQSRPSAVEGSISGELSVDDKGCMRVGEYTIIWPPGAFLREDPLRVLDGQRNIIAAVGDAVALPGAEKQPADYRYFGNKVPCAAPYWAVGEQVLQDAGKR